MKTIQPDNAVFVRVMWLAVGLASGKKEGLRIGLIQTHSLYSLAF